MNPVSVDAVEVIARLIKAVGAVSERDLSKKLGFSATAMTSKRQRGSVPYDECAKVAANFGVSLDWLIFGSEHAQNEIEEDEHDLERLPLVFDLKASEDGEGVVLDENNSRLFSIQEDVLAAHDIALNDCAIVSVRGDSMQPTLESGDLVVIDRTKINADGVFLVRLHDRFLIKRVQREGGGAYVLESDNKKYREILVSPTETKHLTIIGQCMIKIGSLA